RPGARSARRIRCCFCPSADRLLSGAVVMAIPSWLESLNLRSRKTIGRSARARRGPHAALALEPLEDRLAPASLVTLASFFNGNNGSFPNGGLVPFEDGGVTHLFGTTNAGGAFGRGTVFEEVNGTITVLADFNGANGAYPNGGLVRDGSGNLFGTT